MSGYNNIHIYVDNNDGDLYWVAEYMDLDGCIGTGKTKEQALKDLDLAKQSWLEAKKIMNEKHLEKTLLFKEENTLGLNITQKRAQIETEEYKYDFLITRVKKIKGGNEL